MSYEIVTRERSLGQFASGKGLADLREAAEGDVTLKDFFAQGYASNCQGVAQALNKLEGPPDVQSTAKGLVKLIEGQEAVAISNGASEDEEEEVDKDAPAIGDVHVNRPLGSKEDEELKKSDKIAINVPLFIKLMEFAREEASEDEVLHAITERILELLSKEPELTMEDYDIIIGRLKKLEQKDDPGTQEVESPESSEIFPNTSEEIHKRISGNSAISLNRKGHELADKLGERLADKGGLDVLYSSVLRRGIQTADAIAEHAAPGLERAETSALCPWHLGKFEGKMPHTVRDEIDYYIEHPSEVPPGKGADGEEAESFEQAKNRQLSFLQKLYEDFTADPTMKLGVIMHSRGMELVQAWVDAGMKDDFEVELKGVEQPNDPEHTSVLRWHKGEIKEIDVDSDDPLKPGVYLILHGLTNDDTDEGNAEELEKGGPGSGRYPAGSHAGVSHAALVSEHDRLKAHEGRTSSTPSESAVSNYRQGLHELTQGIEQHVKAYKVPPEAKSHLAQASNTLMTRGNTALGREAALMSLHNSLRAIGHTIHKSEPQEARKEAVLQTFLPPLEVHRAAKSAYDQGVSVLDITAPLAEHEGLDEARVRKVAEFFASTESATETVTVRDAWGGAEASKWAGRVLKKIDRDRVEKAGNGVMLAFWPDSETQKKIAVEGGESADQIHLTLMYFGKLDEINLELLPGVERAVQHFANTHAPVKVTLGGIGRFPATPQSDAQDVIYLGVHSDEIRPFRKGLLDAVEASGLSPKKDFEYSPHITLKTVAPHAPPLIATPEPLETTFDRIVLSVGGARKEYLLAGSPVEKNDFVIEGEVIKLDNSRHLVFGWFSVVEVEGREVEDTQGDIIDEGTLEDTAYEFVLHARVAGAMHESDSEGEVKGVGRLVESVVFTREKQEAMVQSLKDQDIPAVLDLKCVAWWGGMKIADEETWKKVTTGHLRAWSIGGKGKRAAI